MIKHSSNSIKTGFPLISTLFLGFILSFGLLSCSSGGGDDPVVLPELSISSPSIIEGDTGNVELVFTLTLSEDAASTFTVDYESIDDTATQADDDYIAVSGTATINQGSRTADISVFVKGDTNFEVDEFFDLAISNPQGIELSAANITGQGTITSDDNAEAPKGYFTGTANVNSLDLTDVIGLAYDNRLMVFSPTTNVLYDISLDPISIATMTGSVEVYIDGHIEQSGNVTITGTTDESRLIVTFSGGTGLASGSFDILFDPGINVGATLARIEATGLGKWDGTIYGIDTDPSGHFISDDLGRYISLDFDTPRCATTGGATIVIPDTELNIYQLNHRVIEDNSCEYITPAEEPNHTGFASIVSINSVDTLVYAFANGSVSLFAVMTK